MNFAQIKAIEKKNKERILKVCPEITEASGIYMLTRFEDGFKYAYIGQAKHLLTRLADHLRGYQHIDLSIKKHGLYSENNPSGWRIAFIKCSCNCLDNLERHLIKHYADKGFQLRNKTAGGQDSGKAQIAEYKPPKGYRDGLKQGYKNAQRYIRKLFDKWLRVDYDKTKKLAERAYQKFNEFIKEDK
ncbi:MAG: GIY-YIG nuclease family protein [Bacillota bacterium]|nr:GIY-YIG nuclease family protein [Bacillota bacterium]